MRHVLQRMVIRQPPEGCEIIIQGISKPVPIRGMARRVVMGVVQIRDPEHGIRALGKTRFRTSGRVTTQLARSLIVGRRPATAITQKRTLPHYAKS